MDKSKPYTAIQVTRAAGGYMLKIRETRAELDRSGWLVIERSRDASDSGNVRKNFGANAAYLKRVFQGK